MLRPKYKVAVP